jgi:hypothetical protein
LDKALREFGMNLVLINPEIEPPYSLGASLLASVAYPLNSELKRRGENHAKLCALALRQVDPATAPFDTGQVHPLHAALADDGFKFGIHFSSRIKTRSMVAAVTMPLLWQDMTGPLPRPPRGMRQVSLAEGIRRAVDLGLTGGAERNFDRQAFKPTLGVLHLVCGMPLVAWDLMQRGRQLDLRDILFDIDILRAIVTASNVFLPHVLKRWSAQVRSDSLWVFQFVD